MKNLIVIALVFQIVMSCSKEDYLAGVIIGHATFCESYEAEIGNGFSDHSGINVTLYDRNNNKKTTFTNADGYYELNHIIPGNYHLKFEKEGFTKYELYEITFLDADTINFTKQTHIGYKVRLMPIVPVEYYHIQGDPYIDNYKGTIEYGPHKYVCGRNYEIVTEVKCSRDFGCTAFISDDMNVDHLNYKLAVPAGTFRRYGIENPIFRTGFKFIDRSVFPIGSTIYIRYYPCNSQLSAYDPWLKIDKYFMLHEDNSKMVQFTLPFDEKYYDGLPGCE